MGILWKHIRGMGILWQPHEIHEHPWSGNQPGSSKGFFRGRTLSANATIRCQTSDHPGQVHGREAVCWGMLGSLMFLKDIWSILQKFHFMFLINIDLISKIFKNLLNRSLWLFGARLWGNCPKNRFSKIWRLSNVPGNFIDWFSNLVPPKTQIIGFRVFWVGLDASRKPEITDMRSLGLCYKQIGKLLYQIEAE